MKQLICLALVACTSTATAVSNIVIGPAPLPPCPATPHELAPDPTLTAALAFEAQGYQRYSCTASGWSAAIPAATLFDGLHEIIRHTAGPTWTGIDSSSVVASKHTAATVDAGSIPWLLLDVVSTGGAKGLLTQVRQIQRLTTRGGLTPTQPCDAAHVGLEVDVPYTASYWFYRPLGTGTQQRCGA